MTTLIRYYEKRETVLVARLEDLEAAMEDLGEEVAAYEADAASMASFVSRYAGDVKRHRQGASISSTALPADVGDAADEFALDLVLARLSEGAYTDAVAGQSESAARLATLSAIYARTSASLAGVRAALSSQRAAATEVEDLVKPLGEEPLNSLTDRITDIASDLLDKARMDRIETDIPKPLRRRALARLADAHAEAESEQTANAAITSQLATRRVANEGALGEARPPQAEYDAKKSALEDYVTRAELAVDTAEARLQAILASAALTGAQRADINDAARLTDRTRAAELEALEDHVVRAIDEAERGEASKELELRIVNPSIDDEGLAADVDIAAFRETLDREPASVGLLGRREPIPSDPDEQAAALAEKNATLAESKASLEAVEARLAEIASILDGDTSAMDPADLEALNEEYATLGEMISTLEAEKSTLETEIADLEDKDALDAAIAAKQQELAEATLALRDAGEDDDAIYDDAAVVALMVELFGADAGLYQQRDALQTDRTGALKRLEDAEAGIAKAKIGIANADPDDAAAVAAARAVYDDLVETYDDLVNEIKATDWYVLDRWESAVPDHIWQNLVDFDNAQRTLSALADVDAGNLKVALDTAESALVEALGNEDLANDVQALLEHELALSDGAVSIFTASASADRFNAARGLG